MSTTETQPSASPVSLTERAIGKVKQFAESDEGFRGKTFRVFVEGGGCSGFQYGFTFDETEEDGDTRIENCGVTLLIDPLSVQYLAGAEIDYNEDLQGAQFVIRNPNASATCGCGSSFSV